MPVFAGQEWHEHRQGSPEEAFNPRAESRATRAVWVPWTDRVNACKAFLGWSEVKVNAGEYPLAPAGRKYIARHTPWPHPDWPAQTFYAAEIGKIAGFTPDALGAGDVGTFQEADCTVNFAMLAKGNQIFEDATVVSDIAGHPSLGVPFDGYALRYMEFESRAVGKYQTIPAASGLKWSDGRAATMGAFVNLFEAEVTVLWRQVPRTGYNFAAMLGCVGKTNSRDWPSTAPAAAGTARSYLLPFAAGNLLWGVPQANPVRQGDGSWCYDVTLRLKWFPNGANKFYRPPAAASGTAPAWPGGYDTLLANGVPLFASTDYDLAFIPP